MITVTFHSSMQEYETRVKYAMKDPESFKEIMKIYSTDNSSIIDCFSIHDEETDSEKGNVCYVSNPFNMDNLLTAMSTVRENVPRDKRVYWNFPNITNMSIGASEDDLLKFCRRAFRYHKQQGDQAIYVFNERAHTSIFFGKLYQLSDVFIKLISDERLWGIENSIQAIKNVWTARATKKAFYDVKENMEIQFRQNKLESKPQIPPTGSLSKIKSFESGDDKEYLKIIRTGIPQLDALFGGGIFSNSKIVAAYQPGAIFAEPIEYIAFTAQNQLGEKTHIISIDYSLSIQQFLTYFKIMGQRIGIPPSSLDNFLNNHTIIDCLNVEEDKTDNRKNNIYSVSNPFDVERLLSLMANIRTAIPEDERVFWGFYTLTDMSIGVPEDELIKFCRRAFRYHKWCGDMALYILNEQCIQKDFLQDSISCRMFASSFLRSTRVTM